MTSETIIRTKSDEATDRLGRVLAGLLSAEDVVYLNAPMGVGKTVLCRGLIRELAGADIDVPSPTFGLVQHYETEPAVTHVDLYRVGDSHEVLELGLDELGEQGILLIEWPENGEGQLPEPTLIITGSHEGASRRWSIMAPEKIGGKLMDSIGGIQNT